MCGISGAYFARSGDPVAAVRAMNERMRLRGPDAAGEWRDEQAGLCLGHRRLSIIDLDARANQPMASHDGGLVMVFNGEIYNYRELKAELECEGAAFSTTSDTEVVLELYRRVGPAAFARLRGMFALAIWDRARRVLVLARDPYGIKPLYVGETPHGSVFASQVKATAATRCVSGAIDPAGVVGFYLWGSVPEPFTVLRDVRPVPAGSWVELDGRKASEPVAYADIRDAWAEPRPAPADLGARVRELVADSVRAHLVADVPVAVFLSGGVDSGAIAGLMRARGQAVTGVTVSFEEFAGGPRDEAPPAAEIARHYGIDHVVRRVGREEFAADVPAILDAMDQPSIDGVNTWFASKAVAELGFKVVLSGVGGDELFCGYDTFRTVPRLYGLGRSLSGLGAMRGVARAPFRLAASLLAKPKVAQIPELAGSLNGAYLLRRGLMMPGELSPALTGVDVEEGLRRLADAASPGGGSATIGAVAALESTRYLRNQLLRDSDWASMAHSLELRTPLVDWTLLKALGPFAAHLTGGRGKRYLAEAPTPALPASIVKRRKTGFGMPIGEWLTLALGQAPGRNDPPWARRWAGVVADDFGLAA